MSDAEPVGLDFRILPESEHEQFRLLELPPELANLLTVDPTAALYLKSRAPDAPTSDGDMNAVLCTTDKTFHVRQVNHSNSVFITRPRTTADADSGSQKCTVEAFATNGFTIEVLPSGTVSATSYLKSTIPVYTSSHSHAHDDTTLRSRQRHFDDIPLSDHECNLAWTELACFELGDRPVAFRPSAAIRMRAWMAILNYALERGIDLTSSISNDQLAGLIEADEDIPRELSNAVLSAMGTEERTIDPDRCVRVVGASHLEERTITAGPTGLQGFLSTWQDAMPEKWRSKVDLKVIQGLYTLDQSDQTVTFSAGATAQPNGTGTTAVAKPTKGTKRNWHEKFRAQKKTS